MRFQERERERGSSSVQVWKFNCVHEKIRFVSHKYNAKTNCNLHHHNYEPLIRDFHEKVHIPPQVQALSSEYGGSKGLGVLLRLFERQENESDNVSIT
jgi:hypothetical protein